MTRSVFNRDQFTIFGLWLRQFCKDSHAGLCITNLDYVVEDYKRRIMLLEEKQNDGSLAYGQMKTFQILHHALKYAQQWNYEYWGVYILQFPTGCDMPGPGMTINGKPITVEQLRDHCNFDSKFCDGYFEG